MIYAVKRSNESTDQFFNRFRKQVQKSRLVMVKRNGRFHKKKKTKTQIRSAAVKREYYRQIRRRTFYYA